MRFEDAVSMAYENTTDSIHADLFGPRMASCAVCEEHYYEDDNRWILPHALAEEHHDCYVCGKACAKEWRIAHAEEIAEWKQEEDVKFLRGVQ